MRELTALDLHYLVQEFQELIGAKVDQVYHSDDVLLRFHSAKFGKKLLRISQKFVFMTLFKEEQPLNPTSFCMTARKYIINARVKSVEQVNFERVLKITLEKDKIYIVYAELFSRGNVIITDEQNNIITATHFETEKRHVERHTTYNIPEKGINFLSMKESEFKEMLKKSNEPVVKTIATVLGLGGIYSEFVLQEFDKSAVSSKLKLSEISKIYKKLTEIRNKKIRPSFYNEKLIPFLAGNASAFTSFNDAFADTITKDIEQKELNKRLWPFLNKKERLEKIISTQKESMKQMEKEIEENTKKAEAIYTNYPVVEDILVQLKKAKERLTWKEIKEKLKDHKTVKEINEGEGKIIIEF